MAKQDLRTVATARKNKMATSGQAVVSYRTAAGKITDALVVSQGTSSGLKLRVIGEDRIVDNVPAATSKASTNAYTARGWA